MSFTTVDGKRVNQDLSKIDGSLANIIETNRHRFDSCTTVSELVKELKVILNENHLDTKATRRLVLNVSKSKDFTFALTTIYNSYLFGSDLAVDRK